MSTTRSATAAFQGQQGWSLDSTLKQEAESPDRSQGPARFLGPQVLGKQGSLGCEQGLFQVFKGAGSGNISQLGPSIPSH